MRHPYGPYEREGSSISIKKTRLLFLWNAKARVPNITADLYQTCYPLYREFLLTHLSELLESPHYKELASASVESLLDHAPGWRDIKSSKQTADLLDRLDEWSIRHNLKAEWCQRWAVTAMKAWTSDKVALMSLSWCKSPELVRYILVPEFYPDINFDYEKKRMVRWIVYQLDVVDFGPDDEPSPTDFDPNLSPVFFPRDYIKFKDRLAPDPPKGLPHWWFTATSRDEYLQEVERLAEEEIKKSWLLSCAESSHQTDYVSEIKRVAAAYCDSVEKFLSKQSGWKKAKVHPDHRAPLKHTIWAVMFQVEGKSYSEIAKEMQAMIEELPAVSTVKRAVATILNTIGLDSDRRQEVKRGPKRGTKHDASTKVRRQTLRSLGR
jgi:hypothetical protein